jgi:hypothetical protein
MVDNLVIHQAGSIWKGKVNIKQTILNAGFNISTVKKNILKNYLDKLYIKYA